MPLKPARRLPRKFTRQTTKDTRILVDRRRQLRAKHSSERRRRIVRRGQKIAEDWLRFLRRWLLITILGILLLALGLLAFSPITEVREIRVARSDPRLNIEQVQDTVASFFGRRLFFLSEADVRTLIQDTLPDVRTVDVRKEYPSTLVVQITLDPVSAELVIRSPDMADVPQGSGTALRDYVTEEGLYVVSPPLETDTPIPVYEITDWGARPVPGAVLFSREFLAALDAAEEALVVQFGHTIRTRTIHLRAQEMHFRTDRFTLWLDVRSPLEQQMQRYRTFLQSVDPGAVKEYVDLRLTDRVVYK